MGEIMRNCAVRSVLLGALSGLGFFCSAAAQTESVIVNFGLHRGRYPDASLLMDASGHLFATTELGGMRGHYAGGKFGTVAELTRSGRRWHTTVLQTFDLETGGFPTAALIPSPKGTLYGTTSLGGNDGCGMVFELEPQNGIWTETVLHNFAYGGDGCVPNGELVRDAGGNLYGVTAIGGAHSSGMVFQLTKNKTGWLESDLYNFTGGADGNRPRSLLMDATGTIYGTASEGGANSEGVVFQLANSNGNWTETVLHSFGGDGDGTGSPYGALAKDPAGNLYGTTINGGEDGQGSVFELSPSNGGWSAATLYSFTGGADGENPEDGVSLASGALYGTTSRGGASGGGTVFELTNPNGTWMETVLHSFSGGSDGSLPYARPIVDKSGTIFGTTVDGGKHARGVAYEITP
jgi:uncharacterized repeat protein (TIGR03803 family)